MTASKYEKNITRETVSMEVLKPDFINNNNNIELDEAIQKVPGLTMIDNQANVRGGSGFAYGAGSRVLVLVNGIPELTGDAGDVKWEFLPVENLDQVEIIKGASSVLYGSSALNGVINLRTRYPTSTPETRIILFQGLFENPKDKSKVWWGNHQPYFSGANFFHSHKFGQFDLVLGGSMANEQSFHEGSYALGGRINANTRYRFRHVDGLSAGINVNYMYFQSGTYFLWVNDTTGAYRALGGVDTTSSTQNNDLQNVARNSVRQLLSQQLNRFAGNYIKGVELNLNVQSYEDYSTGEPQGRTELQLGVSKQMLNNRLKVQVGGNIDIEGEKAKENTVSNIAGDVSGEYKLIPEGTYRLRFYRRNDYDILQGEVIETAFGLVFTKDYDRTRDLFKRSKDEKEGKKVNNTDVKKE